MAINSVEAKKMLDAAKRNNRVLTIGYQSRQRDDSLYMKKEAEEGTFGDIYYANAIAIRRRLFRHGAFSLTNMSREAVRLSTSERTRLT